MTNEEILARLKASKSEEYQVTEDTFSMGKLLEDREAVLKAREIARKTLEKNPRCGVKWYEMYKSTYLWGARRNFDDFLVYLEWNRDAKEKFYLPRRRILKKVVDAFQDMDDGKLDEMFLQMPPRVGKLIADRVPVLTTRGFKPHGKLKVGDYVFSADGKPAKVLAVHAKWYANYEVTFSNGEKIKCHGNHEWVVERKMQGCAGKETLIMETEKLKDLLDNSPYLKNSKTYPVWVSRKEIVNGRKRKFDIEPYEYGFNWKALAENGIKMEYITGDKESKMELFAGLADSFFCLITKEGDNFYELRLNDKKRSIEEKSKFMKDLKVLLSSLGMHFCITNDSKCRNLKIYPPKDMVIPNRVEKKRAVRNIAYDEKVRIMNIEKLPVEKWEQGNCITVERGTYLVGERLIPTHNSSIAMFFISYILGKYPEMSNLYCAFSDVITRALYNGVLEIIQDPNTYLWHEIFPDCKIANTSGKDETIDINRAKRYPTLTSRSLYGSLNGACDCRGYLISDDLLSGIEEALNPDRLTTAWNHVDNNMLARAKEGAKIVWIGTSWSINDPISIRKRLLEERPEYANRRWVALNLPALDENDESNFNYDYGVGFGTEFYKQRRSSFEANNDIASWLAQYQQSPIERQGTLFEPNFMRYYNGELPEGEPDRIFMACDIAWGGGDYLSAPIIYQYGEDCYVHDLVYSNEDKYVTRPLVIDAILRNKVQAANFEANNGGSEYCEYVTNELKKVGYKLNIRSVPAPTNKKKEARIFDKAPEIRELWFRDSKCRTKEYSLAMQSLFSFTMTGKNKNDDYVDSLAMAVDVKNKRNNKAEVFKRPF